MKQKGDEVYLATEHPPTRKGKKRRPTKMSAKRTEASEKWGRRSIILLDGNWEKCAIFNK